MELLHADWPLLRKCKGPYAGRHIVAAVLTVESTAASLCRPISSSGQHAHVIMLCRWTPQARHATSPVCAETPRPGCSSVHAPCRLQTWNATPQAGHATPGHASPRGMLQPLLCSAVYALPVCLNGCSCSDEDLPDEECVDIVQVNNACTIFAPVFCLRQEKIVCSVSFAFANA